MGKLSTFPPDDTRNSVLMGSGIAAGRMLYLVITVVLSTWVCHMIICCLTISLRNIPVSLHHLDFSIFHLDFLLMAEIF